LEPDLRVRDLMLPILSLYYSLFGLFEVNFKIKLNMKKND